MTPSNSKGKCDIAAETRVLTANSICTEEYRRPYCTPMRAIYSAKMIYTFIAGK